MIAASKLNQHEAVYVAEEQDTFEDTQATVAPDLLCATPSQAGVSHHPL
jgi:hypothetical protein